MVPSAWTIYRKVATQDGLRPDGPWCEYRIKAGNRRRKQGYSYLVAFHATERRFAQTEDLREMLAHPCSSQITAMIEALHP